MSIRNTLRRLLRKRTSLPGEPWRQYGVLDESHEWSAEDLGELQDSINRMHANLAAITEADVRTGPGQVGIRQLDGGVLWYPNSWVEPGRRIILEDS